MSSWVWRAVACGIVIVSGALAWFWYSSTPLQLARSCTAQASAQRFEPYADPSMSGWSFGDQQEIAADTPNLVNLVELTTQDHALEYAFYAAADEALTRAYAANGEETPQHVQALSKTMNTSGQVKNSEDAQALTTARIEGTKSGAHNRYFYSQSSFTFRREIVVPADAPHLVVRSMPHVEVSVLVDCYSLVGDDGKHRSATYPKEWSFRFLRCPDGRCAQLGTSGESL